MSVPSVDGSETVLQDASQVFDEGSSRMSSLRMPYTDKPSTSTPGPMCADLGGDGADGVNKFFGVVDMLKGYWCWDGHNIVHIWESPEGSNYDALVTKGHTGIELAHMHIKTKNRTGRSGNVEVLLKLKDLATDDQWEAEFDDGLGLQILRWDPSVDATQWRWTPPPPNGGRHPMWDPSVDARTWWMRKMSFFTWAEVEELANVRMGRLLVHLGYVCEPSTQTLVLAVVLEGEFVDDRGTLMLKREVYKGALRVANTQFRKLLTGADGRVADDAFDEMLKNKWTP